MKTNKILVIFFATLSLTSCEAQTEKIEKTPTVDTYQNSHPEQFQKYWYAGLAEVSRYTLDQARYGSQHPGEAILIYVTEDFLPEKQVKKEFGDEKGISVLKLNMVEKFVTGIYDYALMTSIFTPIDYRKNAATMKVSFSSQDWCGQSFAQMNAREGKLNYQIRSYFQGEGDENISLPATYTEEDIWTRIRLEPQMLPLGKIEMVPSQKYLRLLHKELKAYSAEATLVLQVYDSKEKAETYIYTLKYPELNRELKICTESKFPFKILWWEEKVGPNQVTKATLDTTIMESYWEKNNPQDQGLRDSLNMQYQIR